MAHDQPPCPCEIDHLIPLGLGGTNRPANLWPQSYSTVPWNSKVKDQLEIKLRTEMCHGDIDLAAAQQEIAKDWKAAYCKGSDLQRDRRFRHVRDAKRGRDVKKSERNLKVSLA
jgi:hypothetical protein